MFISSLIQQQDKEKVRSLQPKLMLWKFLFENMLLINFFSLIYGVDFVNRMRICYPPVERDCRWSDCQVEWKSFSSWCSSSSSCQICWRWNGYVFFSLSFSLLLFFIFWFVGELIVWIYFVQWRLVCLLVVFHAIQLKKIFVNFLHLMAKSRR
jgi:hypothetical protein